MSGWRQHWKRYFLLAGISAALILGLVLEADPGRLAARLSTVDVGLVVLVVGLFVGGLSLRALRWHLLLLASEQRVRARTTLVQFAMAQALNDLTPIKVVGEGARIWGMNQEAGVPVGTGFATVITEKIMDLALVSGVLLISIVLLLPDLSLSSWSPLAAVVGLVVLANLAVIAVLLRPAIVRRFGDLAVRLAGRFRGGKWQQTIEAGVRKNVVSFNQALVSTRYTNRRLTTLAVALTVPIWVLEFSRLAIIMAALGAFVSLPAVVVASSLAMTLQVFLPAGSGNVAAISDIFATTGIALATATAAGLLSIATSIWISVPVALVALVLTSRRMGREKGGAAAPSGRESAASDRPEHR